MTLGRIILNLYDRSLAIHRKQCGGMTDDARKAAFKRRMDHIERVMDEMLPRFFPEHYRKGDNGLVAKEWCRPGCNL